MKRISIFNLSERILQLCKRKKITLVCLSEISKVSIFTIQNLVRAKARNPRIKTLHKIALAFGMTPSEFLDFQELNDYAFDEEETTE